MGKIAASAAPSVRLIRLEIFELELTCSYTKIMIKVDL